MHPEIKKFWETMGRVWEQTKPNYDIGVINVPIYWLDENSSNSRRIIAAPYNGQIVYHSPLTTDTVWLAEAEMLRIIKLKAFL